jgi:hypothetical protein
MTTATPANVMAMPAMSNTEMISPRIKHAPKAANIGDKANNRSERRAQL